MANLDKTIVVEATRPVDEGEDHGGAGTDAAENGEGENAAPGGEDYSKSFDPLVVLTQVETKTGEEDEIVLFKIRSKLFRFDKTLKEWKERGTGDVRLLKHKETKKIRLLMRREKTLKICLNHYVNPAVGLSENVGSDRSWVFQAVDYADGEPDEALLAIRFANSDNAKMFHEQYYAAKEHMANLLAGKPISGDTVLTKKADADVSAKEAEADVSVKA